MITEGDPDVLALQRAENYATVLLGDRDWALKERAAARDRLNRVHQRAVEAAKQAKAELPEPPGELLVARAVGKSLAWQCFGLARGMADGMSEIEAMLERRRKDGQPQ